MIHQSGFSWNTREVSDVTTIIHQKKYQLYLFIFAQHFTVIYLHLYPPQPTHIIIHISPCFLLDQALHPKKNHYFIYHPHHPPPKVLAWQMPYCRSSRRCPGTSNTRSSSAGEPLRAGAGGRVGDVPGVRSVVVAKPWWKHACFRPCQVIQELIWLIYDFLRNTSFFDVFVF